MCVIFLPSCIYFSLTRGENKENRPTYCEGCLVYTSVDTIYLSVCINQPYALVVSIPYVLSDLSVVFHSGGSCHMCPQINLLDKSQWLYLLRNWRLYTNKSEVV